MTPTLRICHVNLARGFSGGEQQSLTLIEQQKALGYSVVVVCHPDSPLSDKVTALGCKVHHCQQFLRSHSAAITEGVDMVHVHEGKAVYWALIQHLLTGTPYLITRRIDNPLKDKRLLNFAYRRARHLVGVSHAIALEINKRHPQLQPQVIPDSPVSYHASTEGVRAIKLQFANKFIVIQAAKLYTHKGFDVSIECARALQHSHPGIQFCLLGDGPEEAALKKQAQGLDNLAFMGRQSNMGDWFEAANILIHPSHSEGLGSVILEASNAGLPVIGTRAGGIPDAISPEKNGLLVDIADAEGLAAAVVRMKDDHALVDTIRKQAPMVMEKFKIGNTARQYQMLYQT